MAEEQVAPRNVRRKAKLAFLGRTRVGKLSVSFQDGVAIGPNSIELFALVGRLGRDANLLPFHFLKWPLVDIEHKDRVMIKIKQHFDFPDECNKYVLKQLNATWKDEKGDLKREYFISFATREDWIANRPDKVPKDQWTVLVEYWKNPKTLEKVGKSIINRKRHKIMHTGGSKSFMKHAVEMEEDLERDEPLGTPATRLEIFRMTHTQKDKTPINELCKEKMDQMKDLVDKVTEEGSSMYSTGYDDIFTQVMGPDCRDWKRCFERATFLR
ncbi:Plant transposase (Ptta/En/Spm family) [Abeliophyllum distichum]|uniref:Plant transposase (Ptta/En/Spm family) n=1 Tax=Abeliophyllum distichum TaxID=126358 RepID=A0ABD1W2T3_9LAMI